MNDFMIAYNIFKGSLLVLNFFFSSTTIVATAITTATTPNYFHYYCYYHYYLVLRNYIFISGKKKIAYFLHTFFFNMFLRGKKKINHLKRSIQGAICKMLLPFGSKIFNFILIRNTHPLFFSFVRNILEMLLLSHNN